MMDLYINKKTKGLYVFISEAIDASNSKDNEDKEMIIYKSLSGSNKDKIFVRELSEFHEKFDLVDLDLINPEKIIEKISENLNPCYENDVFTWSQIKKSIL